MNWRRISRRGTIAGLLGAVTVAAWFLLVDTILLHPFFTPGALGSALFLGATDLGSVEVNLWTVGGYTVFHLLTFAVIGFAASALIEKAEQKPYVVLAGLLVGVVILAFFLGLLTILAEFLLGALTWWAIAVGSLLGALAMGLYLWERDPKLEEAVEKDPFRKRHT